MATWRRIAVFTAPAAAAFAIAARAADPLPPDTTYRPLPTQPFSVVKRQDEQSKAQTMQRQATLLSDRYDLSNRAIAGATMSGA